jgi:hypothetical protein
MSSCRSAACSRDAAFSWTLKPVEQPAVPRVARGRGWLLPRLRRRCCVADVGWDDESHVCHDPVASDELGCDKADPGGQLLEPAGGATST